MVVEKNMVVTLDFEVFNTENNEMLEATSNDVSFSYIHDVESFIPKIEKELDGKKIGDRVSVEVSPEEGYGVYDESLVIELSKSEFEGFDDIYVGMDFDVEMDNGEEREFYIIDILDETILADGNHPFAGKNIRFEIKVEDIREATEDELADGYPYLEHDHEGDCCSGGSEHNCGCGCSCEEE